MIGSKVSRYDFQGINVIGIIKWRLYLAGTLFRLSTLLEYSNGGYIDECITRYDLHICNVNFTHNDSQNDRIHSQQVWVKVINVIRILRWWLYLWIHYQMRYKCIDVMSTWRENVLQNGCMHNEQVWVSGNQPYWNTQITAILMNALRDMICIYVMQILRTMTVKMIGPTVSRYEFQVINLIGILKWRLYWWMHYEIWAA